MTRTGAAVRIWTLTKLKIWPTLIGIATICSGRTFDDHPSLCTVPDLTLFLSVGGIGAGIGSFLINSTYVFDAKDTFSPTDESLGSADNYKLQKVAIVWWSCGLICDVSWHWLNRPPDITNSRNRFLLWGACSGRSPD